jgi:hypothetical protein
VQQGPVRGQVVGLVRLARALPRGDRPRQPLTGVTRLDRLEDDERVVLRGEPGLVEQARGVVDPRVLDLAALAVIDEDRQRVLGRAVAEARGDRLLPAADVAVMPAPADGRRADRRRPVRVGHTARGHPLRRLGRRRLELGRTDRAEDAQQAERLRRPLHLHGGHEGRSELRHDVRTAEPAAGQRADHVRSPQFGVDRLPDVGKDLPCLIQDDIGGLRRPQRREKLGDIGFRMTHAAYFYTTATRLALESAQLGTN